MNSQEWLRQCVEIAEIFPMDVADKPNYLAAMAILCNVIFDFQDIGKDQTFFLKKTDSKCYNNCIRLADMLSVTAW